MKLYALLFLLAFRPPEGFAAPRPSLSAPVMLGEENLGETWVYLTPTLAVGRDGMLTALAKVLKKTPLEDFERRTKGREVLPVAELGFPLAFDEPTLTLRLEIEDSDRARRELTVRDSMQESRRVVDPAPFSGYLNASAFNTFLYPAPRSRQPLQGKLGLVSNLHGFVLETGSLYTEKDNYQWRRDDTRLTKDFEAALVRATAGDLQVFTSGYQNSRQLGGVSLSRQYSIQPYLNTRPLNRTEIWVKSPSTVEVYVNDGFVSRMNVSPGPVQLSDFPLFSGINKVDLKIIDGAGLVEWVNLNLLYDSQLLGVDIQEFAYHLGAPSETFRGDRRYDDRNLTFSAFHRRGLTDRFTLGGSFQADRTLWLAGQDFVWLTRLGIFSGDAALSRRNGGLSSGAGRVRYKSLDYKLGADKPVRGALELEYKARPFAAIGAAAFENAFSWRYDLSLSRPLTAYTTTGVGFQYQVNRLGGDDRRSARLDLNSELHPQWRISTNYAIEKENRLAHRFQLTLTWVEAEGKYYGNLSYDYSNKTARAELSRNPSLVVNDIRATVGAQNSPTAARGDALLEYTHEKALLRAEHQSTHERKPTGYRTNTHSTTVAASTALAWVGTTVGWTRPIADSFALLPSRPEYRRFRIPVNPIGDSAEANVNYVGPAVVPTLTSYNETPLVIDGSALPLGYHAGAEYLIARPSYRSGVKVEVGSASTVILAGRLLRPDGAPLALATGVIVGASPANASPVSFFTNREGLFVVEGLNAGAFSLKVDDADYEPHPFTLHEAQAGFVKLPPITLRGAP